jgi:hypothetical protein
MDRIKTAFDIAEYVVRRTKRAVTELILLTLALLELWHLLR